MTIALVTQDPIGPLLTAEDKEKLVQAGLPLITTAEEIQHIIMKLLRAANRVNFDYYTAMHTSATLFRTSLTSFSPTVHLAPMYLVNYPLTEEERQKIASCKKHQAIKSFADKVFQASITTSQIEQENKVMQLGLVKTSSISLLPHTDQKPRRLHPSKEQEEKDLKKQMQKVTTKQHPQKY
jgi:hypothetical protein